MGNGVIRRLKWKFSVYNRMKKMHYFMRHIQSDDTILDIGCYPIKNTGYGPGTNFIEDYFHSQCRSIDALGLNSENFGVFKDKYPYVRLHTFDGVHFPIFEQKYNTAICNAVIEHVGDRSTQLNWLKGVRAICDCLIITTPNRFCVLEPHTNSFFMHWFPETLRNRFLSVLHLPQDFYEGLFWLSKREFCKLLNDAGFTIVKLKCNRVLWNCVDFVAICK